MELLTTNLEEAAKKITQPWSPIELAHVNDHFVHMALFAGEYPGGFHAHDYDELFYVYCGEIAIQMKGRDDVRLKQGEIFVVPKGSEHCPKAIKPSYVLMFESDTP